MTSEIRTNSLKSRAGLSTVTLTDSGPIFSGITTFLDNSIFNVGNINATGVITATSFVGSGANLTGITGTTINNNANNRIITGSGTANTLEGEANLTWDGNSLDLTAGTGNQFPIQIRNDFTPNSQRADYASCVNVTSNNTLRLGSINSNGGVTIQSTRANDSSIKHNLILQPDGGRVAVGTNSPDNILHLEDSSNPYLQLEKVGTSSKVYVGNASGEAIIESTGGAVKLKPNGASNKFILDTSGRLILGHSATDDRDGYNSAIQVSGTTGDSASVSIGRWSANASYPALTFSKSRNGTIGSHTSVQSGDYLGAIQFQGDDGTNYHVGALIEAQVQDGAGNDDIPTDLIFKTNGGTTSSEERLRIGSAGITTFFRVPELDKTPTSGHNSTAGSFGFSVQRSFVRNITAGNVGNFCDYYVTEGNAALMIQISSDTGGHSGTATYYWYGGFLPSSGYGDHWHRIFPAHVGYGHGNGADTGIGNSTAWELLIGGAGVTGSNYKIRVACHVPSGKTNKNIVCTITELRRGMLFYDKSGDSLYAFSGQTDSGSDAINKMWSNSFVVSNSNDSTNYNFREIYHSGNQHLYFANGANQAYLSSSGNWTNASDIAYKKDIEDITYGIDTVKQLKPRKYKLKGNNNNDIGFIAQELELVVPEVVSGDDGSKGVSYGNLTATLTKALQELIAKVEKLEEDNIALRTRLTNLEGN